MRPVGRTCAGEWSHVHQIPRCPELTKFDQNGQFNPKGGHNKPQKLSRSTQTLADDRRRAPKHFARFHLLRIVQIRALRLQLVQKCPKLQIAKDGQEVNLVSTQKRSCNLCPKPQSLHVTCWSIKVVTTRPQTPIPCICETQLADQTFNKFRKMRKQQTPRKLQFDRVAFSKLLVVVGKSTDAMDSCRARTKREFKCTGIKESKVSSGLCLEVSSVSLRQADR